MKCETCGHNVYQKYIPAIQEHLLSCHIKSCNTHIKRLKRKLARIKKFQKNTQGMTTQQKEYYIRHMRY